MSGSRSPPAASYLPLSHPLSATRPTGRRGLLLFIGTAALSGLAFHILFIGLGGQQAVRDIPVVKEWLPAAAVTITVTQTATATTVQQCKTPAPAVQFDVPSSKSKPSVAVGNGTEPWDEEPDLEALRRMVVATKGYFTRDYSLGLGWNNMRYIIEQAVEQGALLNRTTVLPSFIYARSCEWEINSCAAFTPMVNKGDAIGWGEWRDLPIEQQMGYRIPIAVMLDIPHLRKTHNVVTIAEYLRLQGQDVSKEWSNGAWHRDDYAESPNAGRKLTYHVVQNGAYDPAGVIRVDALSGLATVSQNPSTTGDSGLIQKLNDAMKGKTILEWSDATRAISAYGQSDAEIEALLAKNGWAVLHTFAGALGMDYLKSVVKPLKQVVPLNHVKGWIDDFDHITTDILVLEGETHLGRKPGGMRFSTPTARDAFASTVLYGLHPIERVRHLADKVANRMLDRVGGRMWMAGHMRRGDFVTHGWAMEGSVQKHFDRIKGRLDNGRKTLEMIVAEGKLEPFPVPNVVADQTQLTLQPPQEGDLFYLATDERTKEGVEYIKSHGALLIGDLITIEDRREFGWPIMITDVLALVEQAVMGKAYYFYAHAMSSVAGGAVNMRAARGADERSTLID